MRRAGGKVIDSLSDSGTTPVKGETYFYQSRPVVVLKVAEGSRCLIRQSNASKNLDVWVEWEELGGGPGGGALTSCV